MDRNILLHSNGADSTLSSLTRPYHSWRKCFTFKKSPKPPPPLLSNSSSRSLCPWTLLSASSPMKSEMSQVGTSMSNKGQGKLCQVTGASGERLCVQRSSWGNPGVTLSGKGALYFWKHLKSKKVLENAFLLCFYIFSTVVTSTSSRS